MLARSLTLAVVLAATAAHAQPVTAPEAVPPLAQIQDDKQLAATLAQITNDPAIKVNDPKARPLAQALMTEGVKQLKAQAYDQALANFLEAYNKFPSPKILLNIASTLRDMGRGADAANTYQRYLADPATGSERMAEVKELLIKLDEQLTILTVRVDPKGTDVSIDGGPFVAVGSTLLTRVRPGLHMVRARHGEASTETTINGFDGETKDVALTIKPPEAPAQQPQQPTQQPEQKPPTLVETEPGKVQEHVDGWLITGTKYGTDNPVTSERHVRTGYAGPELAPIVPHYEETDTGQVVIVPEHESISSGVVGVLRIDGKGRGAAGGFGIAYAPSDRVELELAGLRSNDWGVYAGFRWRFLTGWVRPYAGAGVPIFFFTDDNMTSRTAVGVRGAGGIELMINGHVSIEGDVGIEHFFNVDGVFVDSKTLDATVFVPTLGVIGRM
jgi:hypothetical protein